MRRPKKNSYRWCENDARKYRLWSISLWANTVESSKKSKPTTTTILSPQRWNAFISRRRTSSPHTLCRKSRFGIGRPVDFLLVCVSASILSYALNETINCRYVSMLGSRCIRAVFVYEVKISEDVFVRSYQSSTYSTVIYSSIQHTYKRTLLPLSHCACLAISSFLLYKYVTQKTGSPFVKLFARKYCVFDIFRWQTISMNNC